MRIELAAPGSMPGLLDLNTLAVQRGGVVAADFFTAIDAGVDITDAEITGEDEDVLAYIERLQQAFYPYPDCEGNAQLIAFRAIAFATNLATRLTQTDQMGTNYEHLPLDTDEPELFTEIAVRGARRYLYHRTPLDLLIGNFVHLIDPDPDYTDNARLLVAHQCIAFDRHLQHQHSQKVLAEGVYEIRQWNGLVPQNLL